MKAIQLYNLLGQTLFGEIHHTVMESDVKRNPNVMLEHADFGEGADVSVGVNVFIYDDKFDSIILASTQTSDHRATHA